MERTKSSQSRLLIELSGETNGEFFSLNKKMAKDLAEIETRFVIANV